MNFLPAKIPFRHLSPDGVDRILSAPAPDQCAKQTRVFAPDAMVLSRKVDYDSLHPVDQIRTFVAFLKAAQSRYDDNFRIVGECDLQGQDVLHKIEMGDDLDVKRGFGMYKAIRSMRRKRRVCKNENDLLRPICAYLEKHSDLISQLERLQGDIAQMQSAIDGRKYTMRTQLFEQEE